MRRNYIGEKDKGEWLGGWRDWLRGWGREGISAEHTHNQSKLVVEREQRTESLPISINLLVLQRPSSTALHCTAQRIEGTAFYFEY